MNPFRQHWNLDPDVVFLNHGAFLALRARAILEDALAISAPAPEDMLGSLAAVPLLDRKEDLGLLPLSLDPISRELFERHRIEVLASVWPHSKHRVLRVSAQLYNDEEQIRILACALRELLG
jgi:isopenicillin-N epimerase